MSDKHTPGPWELDESEPATIRADFEFVTRATMSRYSDGRDDPEARANVRLIVAAPELLAALQAYVNAPPANRRSQSLADAARAAIAKVQS